MPASASTRGGAGGDPGLLERAIRFDPYFSHNYLHHLGVAHVVAGDNETAAAIFRERILLAPETDMSRALLAAALGNLGYLDEARAVWRELLAITPGYSVPKPIASLPFRNPADLARILKGLERAGLTPASRPQRP